MRTRLTVLLTVVVVAGVLASPVASANGVWDGSSDLRLTADHEGSLTITADGVTLDCDGHAITAVSGGDFAGVYADGLSGVVVKNCHISGFDHGILFNNTTDSGVLGNSLTANWVGIVVEGGTGIRVVDNLAESNTNAIIGIAFSDGLFQRNRAYGDHSADCYRVYAMTSTEFKSNVADGCSIGYGASDGSHSNIYRNNEAIGAEIGFLLWGSPGEPPEFTYDNVVRGNVVSGCATGFDLRFMIDSRIVSNVAVDNEWGITLGDYSAGNSVERNKASHNSGGGISLFDGADDNVVRNNVAEYNGDIAVGDGLGFTVGGYSDDNVFSGNKARHNGSAGFAVGDESTGNHFLGNQSSYNGEAGFFILGEGVVGNTVEGNTMSRNLQGGVQLGSGAIGNWIVRNRILDNDFFGVWASDTPGINVVEGNLFCLNEIPWGDDGAPFTEFVDNKVCGPDN